MTEAEFNGLKEDIKANGQRNAGVLLDGEVLDGWHRYLACKEIGVEMRFDNFPDLVELGKIPDDPRGLGDLCKKTRNSPIRAIGVIRGSPDP